MDKTKPNPEYKQAARVAKKFGLEWVVIETEKHLGTFYEKRYTRQVGPYKIM